MKKTTLKPVGFRLDPETIRIIKEQADILGISQAGVIRIAIRFFARIGKK